METYGVHVKYSYQLNGRNSIDEASGSAHKYIDVVHVTRAEAPFCYGEQQQYSIKLSPLGGPQESGAILASVEPSKTTSLVAYVYDQNGQSVSGAKVQLEITEVIPNSGGHRHHEARPKGTLNGGEQVRPDTVTGSTGTSGLAFSFAAPAVAGDHKITASCTDGKNCSQQGPETVWVGVKGLQAIGDGPWVLVGQDDVHPDNHYLAPIARQKVTRLAELYHQKFPSDQTLRFNDASLERGGLLDIKYSGRSGWWTSPHETHRLGTEIDVRANEFVHADAIPYRNYFDFEDLTEKILCEASMHSEFTRNQHYHVTCR
ncbi:MAG: hypothetical protein HZA69_02115 [Gammaproteobacteria bacterium]|nr:hypothetical protein [Gammaproteobacteria bacterium]